MALPKFPAPWKPTNVYSHTGAELDEFIHQAEQAAVAREREACAKVAEHRPLSLGGPGETHLNRHAERVAAAIRARSEPEKEQDGG